MFGILDGIFGILDESSLQNREIFSEKLVFLLVLKSMFTKLYFWKTPRKITGSQCFSKSTVFPPVKKQGWRVVEDIFHCINWLGEMESKSAQHELNIFAKICHSRFDLPELQNRVWIVKLIFLDPIFYKSHIRSSMQFLNFSLSPMPQESLY